MKFKVNPKIFEKYPEVILGIIYVSDLDNSANSKALNFLRKEESSVREFLKDKVIVDLPVVSKWREIYKSFGSKPSKFKSSIEALLRREKKGEDLPDINSLVNFYNALSLKYKIPFGAEDLGKIVGDVELTFSDGYDACKLIGKKEYELADKGEVVYKDKIGVICRKWNWREADRTKITEDTNDTVLVFEVNNGDVEFARKVLADTMAEIKNLLGVKPLGTLVDVNSPAWEITFETEQEGEKLVVEEKGGGKKAVKKKVEKQKYYPKTEIERKLYDVLVSVVKEKFEEEYVELIELEHPADESHGDFSTNIAMRLAGKLQKNTKEIAQEIVEEFNPLVKGMLKKGGVATRITYHEFPVGILKDAQIAGPGFINFLFDKSVLVQEVVEVINLEGDYGNAPVNQGKRYMVEFSQPNPMKAFHIGHLKGTLYGESLSRILEATGMEVIRANYQGDVGLHIAKIIWAAMQEHSESFLADLESKSLIEKVDFIQQLYVKGSKAFEENDSTKEAIYKLNDAVNNQEESIQKYYKPFRQWSIDRFNEIYKRLDTGFDRYYYESETIAPAYKHVEDAISKGILEKEKAGAVVFRGEDYGLHTRVFITEKGQPTYEAKDLELGYLEATEHGALDKQLFLIGAEQKGYLQVVFKVRELLFGDLLKNKQEHVVNGFVNVRGIKMSSRTGIIVKAEDVLDEAVNAISKVVAERDYSEEEKSKISEDLGVAAVKYSILKNNPNKDTVFDLKESVSVEGQSAPYIMYAYTRAQSILGDASGDFSQRLLGDVDDLFTTDSEVTILRTLYKFPEVVQNAAENYAPNYIADYIFDLAQKFNAFYRECPVLKAEGEVKNSRLLLTAAVSQVLKNGLYLLGIEVLERM